MGTVQVRSLVEPIRKIIARLRGHFVQGKAVDLIMNERLLEVEAPAADGTLIHMYIPYVLFKPSSTPHYRIFRYDKLVIAAGSSSSTHGVAGLQHCFQLKSISDAQAIRRRILGLSTIPIPTLELIQMPDNFETASLPTTSPEDRKRLLSFVVCGGGPTGVETAAVSTHHFDVTYLNRGLGDI